MTEDLKQRVGQEVASRVQDGDVIGVGTGTTVAATLVAIKNRLRDENLKVGVVPTSYQSAWMCNKIGLTVLHPGVGEKLSWGFDGADEVDERKRLIKGRGGAMFHEKIVAARCKKFVVMITEDKFVTRLGEKMAVPIEVSPNAIDEVRAAVAGLGATEVVLREAEALDRKTPYFTQEGNLVIDARFELIEDSLEAEINSIPWVVENGIFTHFASEVLIASPNGVRSIGP